MARYRLSVDKTVNSMDIAEIETDLSETELDALLDKIEKSENQTTAEYMKKLKNNGIRVNKITINDKAYYKKAEVIEIDKVEKTTVFGYLTELKNQVSTIEFKLILSMADEDIKFNRIKFGKLTKPQEYIDICDMCRRAVIKCL